MKVSFKPNNISLELNYQVLSLNYLEVYGTSILWEKITDDKHVFKIQ